MQWVPTKVVTWAGVNRTAFASDLSPTWESICWPNNSRLVNCIFDSKINLNSLRFHMISIWKHWNFASWLGILNCISLTCLLLCKLCYDYLCVGKASSHNKNQLSRAAVSRLGVPVILPISMFFLTILTCCWQPSEVKLRLCTQTWSHALFL